MGLRLFPRFLPARLAGTGAGDSGGEGRGRREKKGGPSRSSAPHSCSKMPASPRGAPWLHSSWRPLSPWACPIPVPLPSPTDTFRTPDSQRLQGVQHLVR